MKTSDIFKNSINFGTHDSDKNLLSFTIKMVIYMLVSLILGHYTDEFIESLYENKVLGEKKITYIILQTFIIIFTFYIFILFFKNFTGEFQVTIPGAFFTYMYFGVQHFYVKILKDVVG